MRFMLGAAAAVLLAAPAHAVVVSTENGNVVIRAEDGRVIPLTEGGKDSEPVISADEKFVVFTRAGTPSKAMEACSASAAETPAQELWAVNIDGSGARKLLETKPSDDVKNAVCGFIGKQFDIEGGLLYFETPAWATDNAIHVLDLKTGKEKFVVAGSSFGLVTCTDSPYSNHIIASQHRYYIQGGSYDWYYLFKPDGTEVGTFGEEPSSFAELCGE